MSFSHINKNNKPTSSSFENQADDSFTAINKCSNKHLTEMKQCESEDGSVRLDPQGNHLL